MKVGIFRGGCLTGPSHSGVELHGFLSYLVKVTLSGSTYSDFGYRGKQVLDNIHSYDVMRAIEEFAANPAPARCTTWAAAAKTASPCWKPSSELSR
jgi:CDP-paratose 2-epimerase